jgi:hypothetical protein
MTIVETVLVFAGIPGGAFALAAATVLGPGAARAPRYRPGGPWEFSPVWYLPHPDWAGPISSLGAAGGRQAIAAPVPDPVKPSGGASGEW